MSPTRKEMLKWLRGESVDGLPEPYHPKPRVVVIGGTRHKVDSRYPPCFGQHINPPRDRSCGDCEFEVECAEAAIGEAIGRDEEVEPRRTAIEGEDDADEVGFKKPKVNLDAMMKGKKRKLPPSRAVCPFTTSRTACRIGGGMAMLDDATLAFGKHSGSKVSDLALAHPGYLVWLIEDSAATPDLKRIAKVWLKEKGTAPPSATADPALGFTPGEDEDDVPF